MNTEINKLIDFALQHHLIRDEDVDYAVNLLLDLFRLDHFERDVTNESIDDVTETLEKMLNYAVEKDMIKDSIVERDLFDTRVMNCVMPRPSEVVKRFKALYQDHPKKATDDFYQLSIASHYIRKDRTDKNIRFKKYERYGEFEITINLSKPEKDPKDIAKAKLIKKSGYPKCLLCKENVGFAGDYQRPARQTHRIIPLDLDGETYYLQYSPYVYYNEHCIVFNQVHKPMEINKETFSHLLTFVSQFPHYMLGSNADLPIVGGSILTHDHFQGGCYHFPMEDALVIAKIPLKKYPDLLIEILKWPLSTIRVSSHNRQSLVDFASVVLEKWRQYSNLSLDILSHTHGELHNTITPIARMKDHEYQLDLVLRNNRTSEQYPDGIFHPHQNLHHIKKENIGLIEVMGLAILPGRLKDEISLLKDCLVGYKDINDYEELSKHKQWYEELKGDVFNQENIDDMIKDSLTKKFVCVLEDAGVFKMNDQGIQAFVEFVESLEDE